MMKKVGIATLFSLMVFGVLAGALDAQTPRTPIQLDTGNAAATAYDPVVCCDSGRVYTAWSDLRTGGNGIYFALSTDNGKTFGTEVRLDSDVLDARKDLNPNSIYANGADVYIYWFDQRNGMADDIYVAVSHNGGVSFDPEVRIDDTDLPGVADVRAATMAADGQNIFIAMAVEIGGGNEAIIVSASNDGGANFTPGAHAGNGNAGDFDVDSIGLDCFGTQAFVGFDDNSLGNDDAWGTPFDSAGVVGTPVRVDMDLTGLGDVEYSVDVCMTSALNIHVFWQEERTGTAAEELRYNASVDGGLSFNATDVLLGTYVAGTDDVDNVKVACSGTNLIVVWEDNRTAADEAYTVVSHNDGLAWGPDVQVSTNGASYPRVALAGDIAGVAWAAPGTPDDAWVAWSRDGGDSFGPEVNMSSSAGDVDYVEIAIDTVYFSCHVAYLDDVILGGGTNNVYTNAFRSARLTLVGSGISGQPHNFHIEGCLVGESTASDEFQVACSYSLGSLAIPGDGRDVGIAFDSLFRTSLNYSTMLTGPIAADGSGDTTTFPLIVGTGTTFYAVAVVKLAGGGYGSLTDPIEIVVN